MENNILIIKKKKIFNPNDKSRGVLERAKKFPSPSARRRGATSQKQIREKFLPLVSL